MLFNSYSFLLFFPIVTILYFAIPKKYRYLWLLVASYYFYMGWNAKYALLLLSATAITYVGTIILSHFKEAKKETQAKWTLAITMILNFSLLFFFKYFDFAIENINHILSAAHITLLNPKFDVLLPVGISFYIFQSSSYAIDVYNEEIKAERNFLVYALFVSFFPQLVAGPIERSKNLLGQLKEPKDFSYERMLDGLMLMLWGFFLKIVIADRITILVDTVYGDYAMYSRWYLVLATFLFSIQIYCDFYGYSVIAMGAAKVLGVSLMENFNAPYMAKSIREFWNRWHISLSTWLRDYIFNPLAMKWNRRLATKPKAVRKRFKQLPAHAALFVTFLISGLWHGSKWSFVCWGGLHGVFQIVGDWTTPGRKKIRKTLHINADTPIFHALQILGTFVLVTFSYIFFRANSATEALSIIAFILKGNGIAPCNIVELGLPVPHLVISVVAIIVLLISDYLKCKGIVVREWILKQKLPLRWFLCAGAILFILIFGIWGSGYQETSFIYFQF